MQAEGDPDAAIANFDKAMSLSTERDSKALAYYGVALMGKQRYVEAVENFQAALDVSPTWALPQWGLAWSSFGQIKKGCPCGPEDEALVAAMIEHNKKAAEFGINDPRLQERVDILAKGEKIK